MSENGSRKGMCSGGRVLASAKQITAVDRVFDVRKMRASRTDETNTAELA